MSKNEKNFNEEANELNGNVNEKNELFEEVEEVVTADWTGCASCCG